MLATSQIQYIPLSSNPQLLETSICLVFVFSPFILDQRPVQRIAIMASTDELAVQNLFSLDGYVCLVTGGGNAFSMSLVLSPDQSTD